MRILVVEDEQKVAQFIKRSLEEVNYSTKTVRTCAEAHDALADSPYDAIILDLGLPDGEGLTVLKEWRAIWRNHSAWRNCWRVCGRCCAGRWTRR